MITYVPWGPQVMGMIEWGKNQNIQKITRASNKTQNKYLDQKLR